MFAVVDMKEEVKLKWVCEDEEVARMMMHFFQQRRPDRAHGYTELKFVK